jgi:Family of unknown function (DUF6529)
MAHLGSQRLTSRMVAVVLCLVLIPVLVYVLASSVTNDYTVGFFGRTGTDAARLKAWFASVILALVGVQVFLALWMYRKIPALGRPTKAVRRTHRTIGFLAFALSLPVAVHCIQAYGVELHSGSRAALHTLAGCFFYGAFVAKVLVVRSRQLPGWALPVAGGLLALTLVTLWYSAGLWVFHNYSVPGLH